MAVAALQTPYSYRGDPAVATFADDKPIIVFDGHCSFCSNWVQFALRHDRSGQYRFLPAQSELGAALYRHYGLHPTNYETNVLLTDGLALFESEGTIRMIAGLGWPWSLINAARLLPRPWRDWGYRLLARNRFRWFGRTDACFVPGPAFKDRFIA
ncbi:thiol-disulfide oxidoreductase DCC family protein [Devosia sp.]|uniref:thiol-disulfide oxidoreductase DCC family protein n=1 Tax=Devosia sp. TaxID=1871048 RepID=UPI0032656F09